MTAKRCHLCRRKRMNTTLIKVRVRRLVKDPTIKKGEFKDYSGSYYEYRDAVQPACLRCKRNQEMEDAHCAAQEWMACNP